MLTITILVPALNEEPRIAKTLDTALGALSSPDLEAQILVVDDGSTDATAAIVADYALRHPSVTLLRHPRNRGLGQALRTALQHAKGEKFLIVPGDNDLPADTIRLLVSQAGAADLVMCYFPDRGQRGRMRKAISALFGWIYSTVFDVHVEYLNGPCVYPTARLRQLQLFSNRFSIVTEINVKLLRQGVSFLEMPSLRQTGLEGSTSLSFRNLREVTAAFFRLGCEIHLKNRRAYGLRPRRVLPSTIG
jgi:glycosyltransferase involved in cell wall biosynthesis